MASEKDSAAIESQRAMIERMQRRIVAPELDAARGAVQDPSVHGRNCGAPAAIPVVREVLGGFTPPSDNGAEYPGPGVPPAKPLEK